MLEKLRNSFFGFEALRRATLSVVRKMFFGEIVSDGPKGQLKQSNMHVEIKKQWRIVSCVRMMLTWDSWRRGLSEMSKIHEKKFEKTPDLCCGSHEKYHKSTSFGYTETLTGTFFPQDMGFPHAFTC